MKKIALTVCAALATGVVAGGAAATHALGLSREPWLHPATARATPHPWKAATAPRTATGNATAQTGCRLAGCGGHWSHPGTTQLGGST